MSEKSRRCVKATEKSLHLPRYFVAESLVCRGCPNCDRLSRSNGELIPSRMLSSLFSGRSLPSLNLCVSALVPIRLLPIPVQTEAELLLEFAFLHILKRTFSVDFDS